MVYGLAAFSRVGSKVLMPLSWCFLTSVEVTGGWSMNWVVWILLGKVEQI